MHLEEDNERKARIVEDMRTEIHKLHADLDQQRNNQNAIERSKGELIQKFEDLKFDI